MTAKTDDSNQDAIDNAEIIIERFGGIRPMAGKMNVPVTTVQGWKKRKVIPGNRRREVMEAARSNNIDLSGLIEDAANENTVQLPREPVQERKALSMTSMTEEEKSEDNTAKALEKGPEKHPAPDMNDEMLGRIKQAQNMAFTKSAWFTVAFVGTIVGLSAFLLWPGKDVMTENNTEISRLQEDVAGLKEQHSFLKALIPDNIEQRFSRIQEETVALRGTVETLASQMQTIAETVAAPNTTVTQKLEALETGAIMISAPEQLLGLLETFKTMQQSATGQEQLSAAVGAALDLVATGTMREDANLALEESPILEQTMENIAPQDVKAAILLLGLTQFRDSLDRSTPFADDLALVQSLMGDGDPALQTAIERLAPHAEKGVLSPEGLKTEFKGLAGDIVVASLKGEDVSIQEKAMARLNDVLQVEKDGALITGTDTQAVIARAQKNLDEGDIQGAIAELQALEGEAAVTAAPWIEQAQTTLTARQVQGLLTGKAVDLFSGRPGVENLIREIGALATTRHVYTDEASGITILDPKPSLTP